MDTTLDQLSKKLFQYLHQMDDEADTPSGCNSHAGLIDYANYAGLPDKKYEDSWNNRLAELLKNETTATSRESRYPNNSRKKGDIVIQDSNIKIWLETKSAWKHWFSSKTGKQENNSANYNGYFFGDGKTHSVAHDIEKLNQLNKEDADYIGLLVIGFDIADDPIDPDIEQLIETKDLKKEGWEIYGPEIWPDRNHPDCRYNCWFLGKKISMKEQTLIYSAYCKDCNEDISSSSNQDEALQPALQHCKELNHELVFGMVITWIEEPKDREAPEHVAYCKVCLKDIAKGSNKDAEPPTHGFSADTCPIRKALQ